MTPFTAPLLGISLLLVGAAWTWQTFRRLWRRGDSPYEQIVYGRGVRGFGLGMFILMTGWGVTKEVAKGRTPTQTALVVLILVVWSAPVWLWGGYLWGRMMAASFGHQPPSTSSSDPHL